VDMALHGSAGPAESAFIRSRCRRRSTARRPQHPPALVVALAGSITRNGIRKRFTDGPTAAVVVLFPDPVIPRRRRDRQVVDFRSAPEAMSLARFRGDRTSGSCTNLPRGAEANQSSRPPRGGTTAHQVRGAQPSKAGDPPGTIRGVPVLTVPSGTGLPWSRNQPKAARGARALT
jgi:hypothetical protein